MDCIKKFVTAGPGKGMHSHYGGIAIIDYILTIIAAIILTATTGLGIELSTIGFMVMALLSHVFANVPTKSTRQLFGR